MIEIITAEEARNASAQARTFNAPREKDFISNIAMQIKMATEKGHCNLRMNYHPMEISNDAMLSIVGLLQDKHYKVEQFMTPMGFGVLQIKW